MIIAENSFRMGYILGEQQWGSGTPFVPSGTVLQSVTTRSVISLSTALQIPLDGTTPLFNEGELYPTLDTVLTPLKADSRIIVTVWIAYVSCNGPSKWIGALFRNPSAASSARAANVLSIGAANETFPFTVQDEGAVLTVGVPATYRFRFGPVDPVTAQILPSGVLPGDAFMNVRELSA